MNGTLRRCSQWLLVATVMMLGWAGVRMAPAQEADETPPAQAAGDDLPVATPRDGQAYPISAITLRYEKELANQPSIEELMQAEVVLVRTPTGYIAPPSNQAGAERTSGGAAPGSSLVNVKLTRIPALGVTDFHGSALRAIALGIVQQFNDRNIVGVYVRPDASQIDDTGKDLRPAGQTSLTLLVATAHVSQIRTLAQGERVPVDDGVNNKLHYPIASHSPVKVGDIIEKDKLDDYTYMLNRHPGRRVDVTLGPGNESGGAVLDYMTTENKPWMVYYQAANTGTKSTGDWRHRFGFMDSQLTNDDDILSLDYLTSDFDKTNAALGSYEGRVFGIDQLRWRVRGVWSEFVTDNLGPAADKFDGDQWSAGGDVIWNVYQYRQLFVDLTGGATYQHIRVNNRAVDVEGQDEFFLPHGGVSLERNTDVMNTHASMDFSYNVSSVAGTSKDELVKMGRVDVQKDFGILSWSMSQSMYLEPIINPQGWADTSTPGSSTLAHEISLSFKGQYSFGDRLIPQFEGAAGGLYTVRGYDESAAAGDDVMIAGAEYRFHLPRIFAIDTNPYAHMLFGKPFRLAPQEVYGRPDWDLVLKGFFDYGKTFVNDAVAAEKDETLMGTGVGLELVFKRNLSVRMDYGWALKDAGPNKAGDSRLHIVATILY